MKALACFAFILLGACSFLGSHAKVGGSSDTSSAGSPGAREMPTRVGDEPAPSTKVYLEADEIRSLRGLTVEQAKARAKKLGFTGKVEVRTEDEFVEGCKPATVCSATSETGSSTAIQLDRLMLLYTNKALDIAAPSD